MFKAIRSLFIPPRPPTPIINSPNPWVWQMSDPMKDGLVVRGVAGGTERIFELFDYQGAPIAGCNQAGGLFVAGDNFRVLWPSVFDASITLWKEGAITFGGPDGVTFYSSADDPNVVAPPHGQPFHNGDRHYPKVSPFTVRTYSDGTWIEGS